MRLEWTASESRSRAILLIPINSCCGAANGEEIFNLGIAKKYLYHFSNILGHSVLPGNASDLPLSHLPLRYNSERRLVMNTTLLELDGTAEEIQHRLAEYPGQQLPLRYDR